MGIASAVFWIMIGIVYLVYRCYKEHPKETLIVVCSLAVILICLAIIYALSIPFNEIDPIVGEAFKVVTCLIIAFVLLRSKKNDEKKAREEADKNIHEYKKRAARQRIAQHLADNNPEFSIEDDQAKEDIRNEAIKRVQNQYRGCARGRT